MKTNSIIYQIFPRNYSLEGTFKQITKDLKRIKDLGVDIIYLMPIHEIGIKNRKGTYGSPYAIKDYYSISPDLGSLSDLKELIDKTHDFGMKIILDMVFNHTSPDNVLLEKHEDYYFHKNGKLGNRVGEWSDIVDLDTHKEETQNYLVDVLVYWNKQGIDGFRFDVASLIDINIFKKARQLLGKDVIFIAESVDTDFANYIKSQNDYIIDDNDLYPTFDSLYNYNYLRNLERYWRSDEPIDGFINQINNDGLNLRLLCLENHDVNRISSILNKEQLAHYLDFFSFIKGQVFLYAGQEYSNSHKPELFEKDPVDFSYRDLDVFKLYQKYIDIKKNQKEIIYQHLTKVDETHLEVEIRYIDGQEAKKVFFLPHN